jgi:hypothetical protein
MMTSWSSTVRVMDMLKSATAAIRISNPTPVPDRSSLLQHQNLEYQRRKVRFAKDSPLEGDGFELPVPGEDPGRHVADGCAD